MADQVSLEGTPNMLPGFIWRRGLHSKRHCFYKWELGSKWNTSISSKPSQHLFNIVYHLRHLGFHCQDVPFNAKWLELLIWGCQKWNISMARPWVHVIPCHISVRSDFCRVFGALNFLFFEALGRVSACPALPVTHTSLNWTGPPHLPPPLWVD